MTDDGAGRARTLDAVVRDEIAGAPPERRRRIAVALAELALDAVPILTPELDVALEGVKAGHRDHATRDLIAEIARRIDDVYLDMFDDEKPGGRTPGWDDAFRAARYATAVCFAFDDDPTVAATEAAYEALHVLVGDPDAVRRTVLNTP